jgi:nucleoside-diphosphate-sugar epimerase
VRSIVHVADPPISFRFAVETIADVLGRKLPRIPFPLPLARVAAVATEAAFRPFGKTPPLSRKRLRTLTNDVALDTSETERLGFVSRHELRASVETTVAWYRAEKLL